MALSNDLISQFVKITNDKETTKKETTMYGVTVIQDGKTYVQLDGSDRLTPVSTTTNTKSDERVMVMIKNHTATIIGNVTSPSARLRDINDQTDAITELEIIVADKADISDLTAANARIDTLVAEDVLIKNKLIAAEADIDSLQTNTLEIRDELTAANATITELQTDKLDASIAEITYATITDLDATNVNVHNLEATYGEFEDLTTEHFTAIDATIEKLDATYATITELDAERARIDDLEAGSLTADSAVITQLKADIADIDTLIFGSASGTVIQTSFANAVIAQLGNAQIKSAMIESVSADKITAGDIITNNVRVMSEDGKLLISDETIQISDTTRVRVQIGKDAAGDYSINIWDADGNLMFSEGGITDSAIKEAIIRDDMVSDTANISAHKLNIESLFEEINGGTQTIKSSKIYFDSEGQTLDVVFTDLSTDIDELQETVTSQGTSLSVVQGQISSKVWQQDIDDATDEMTTKYTSLEQTVDGIDVVVTNHTVEISDKADKSEVAVISEQVAEVELSLSGFKSTVSDTYATKADMTSTQASIEQNADSITLAAQRITQNETDIASLQITTSGLTSRVTETEKDVETALVNAANAQVDIDELEIGGRNLFEKSDDLSSGAIGHYFAPEAPPYTITREEDPAVPSGSCMVCTIGEITTALTSGGFYLAGPYGKYIPKMIVGEMYTVSVWVKGGRAINYGAMTAEFLQNVEVINRPNLSTEWQRYTIRGLYNGHTTSSIAITFYYNTLIQSNDVFYFSSPQIEKGNRATDWSIAQEDLALSADTARAQTAADEAKETATRAETLVQQLSDSISMLVTDGNGTSLMTQTESGWTFSTAEIQSSIATAAEALAALDSELGDTNHTVDVLKQAVNDLGEIAEYVKIGTYEDEPCIELGEGDSDFKLLITNTRILFLEGSSVIAHITNQSLHIKKAVIEEELQQGGFVWKVRSNGNMGLVWKGVS